MIEINSIKVSFKKKEIISNMSFNIEAGKKIAFIGPSGEGKSVLLKTIVGLIQPSLGSVKIDGIDMYQSNEKSLIGIRKKIGVLFQGGALFDFLNIEDNLAFSLSANENLSKKEMQFKIDESLDMVGLRGSNQKMPDELSGGMQKRAALARAIIRKPKYMFYDEPTSGLDPILSSVIDNLISYLNETLKMSSFTITHNIESLERISDEVFLIFEGKIIYSGSSHDLRDTSNLYIKQFISGSVEGPISTNR